MEKLDAPNRRHFKRVLVWADDLRAILSAIKDADETPNLIADNIKYDSLEEFVNALRSASPTAVNIMSNSVQIRFNKVEAYVEVLSNKNESLGLFHKLISIIRNCETNKSLLYDKQFFFITLGLFVFLALSFQKVFWEFIICDYAYGIWFLISSRPWRTVATIKPLYKHKVQGFWAKNHDRVLIQVLGAIICAAMGVALIVAYQSYYPKSQSGSAAPLTSPQKN